MGTEPDFRKDSFVLNANTSIELFSHAKSDSRDIVETILNDENLTNTAKNVDRTKNNVSAFPRIYLFLKESKLI